MLELISYVLILSVVRTQLHVTPAFPTSETVPVPSTEQRHTTSQEVSCSCLPCERNLPHLSTHTQNHFCQSDAVIQGRVTKKVVMNERAGIWLSDAHIDRPRAGNPQHYELSIRVLHVYGNQGSTKVSLGDKIAIRTARMPSCPACENMVENFEDEVYTERYLKAGEKYIFFIPTLADGYGDKAEGILNQCSRVWRYTKRDRVEPGYIPLSKRYLLYSTTCDKCSVTGCFQDKCVKAGEEKHCPARDSYRFHSEWIGNSCQPIMDLGICFYSPKLDTCRWTSVSSDGLRSRKPIKDCVQE